MTFDALQGELYTDGDVEVMASGSGPINGVPTNITFMASKTAGVISYSLINSDTLDEIAGGTGEPGNSVLELHAQRGLSRNRSHCDVLPRTRIAWGGTRRIGQYEAR